MNKKLLTILLSVLLPAFLVSAVVYATTSVGDNITVEDALTVTGVTTLNGNAVLGNAAGDTVTVAGPMTLSGAVTTGIALTGTKTTGISIASTTATGINFLGGAATQPIKIGVLSSDTPGSGVILNDSNLRVVDVHAEDNDVASANTAITLSAGRFRLVRYASSVAEDYALHGLVKYTTGVTKSRWGAGVIGAAETSGTVTLSNLTTGVLGRFGTSATLTLTGASDRIAAVTAFNNNTVALAGSGKAVGLLVMETDVGTPQDLDYGLEIQADAAATGIKLGTVSATGIDIGTAATGLTFTGGYTTTAIQLGTSGSKMTLAAHDDHAIDINVTSASTDTSNSVRPLHMITTMTGTGGVGGRAEFQMTATGVLGGWANALKGYTTFTGDGAITGLASAIVAEMDLPNTTMMGGVYYPLEIELTPGSSTVTQGSGSGNNVGFIYAKVNTNVDDFADNGMIINLQGLGDAAAGHIFQAATNNKETTHKLRIMIGTTPYYILLTNTAD